MDKKVKLDFPEWKNIISQNNNKYQGYENCKKTFREKRSTWIISYTSHRGSDHVWHHVNYLQNTLSNDSIDRGRNRCNPTDVFYIHRI